MILFVKFQIYRQLFYSLSFSDTAFSPPYTLHLTFRIFVIHGEGWGEIGIGIIFIYIIYIL